MPLREIELFGIYSVYQTLFKVYFYFQKVIYLLFIDVSKLFLSNINFLIWKRKLAYCYKKSNELHIITSHSGFL